MRAEGKGYRGGGRSVDIRRELKTLREEDTGCPDGQPILRTRGGGGQRGGLYMRPSKLALSSTALLAVDDEEFSTRARLADG